MGKHIQDQTRTLERKDKWFQIGLETLKQNVTGALTRASGMGNSERSESLRKERKRFWSRSERLWISGLRFPRTPGGKGWVTAVRGFDVVLGGFRLKR
jgi:hypothetical protein